MSKRTLVCIMRSKAGTAKWWPAVPILIPIKSTVEERQREIAGLFPANGLLKNGGKICGNLGFLWAKITKMAKKPCFLGFFGPKPLVFLQAIGLNFTVWRLSVILCSMINC